MRLADERLYRDKTRRPTSANRQMRDVLIRTMNERAPQLYARLFDGVEHLVVSLGRTARLDAEELDVAARAAELQYIGKMAIPDEILNKSGDPQRARVGADAGVHGDRRADPERRAGPGSCRQGDPPSLEPGTGPDIPMVLRGEQIPALGEGHRSMHGVLRDDIRPALPPALTDLEALLEIPTRRRYAIRSATRPGLLRLGISATRGAALSRASQEVRLNSAPRGFFYLRLSRSRT